MKVYIPASFCEEDYTPSWTGNYAYPTVTIRGIFESSEKAERSIKNWNRASDCMILVREVDDGSLSFNIDLEEDYLSVQAIKHGEYGLNKIVDEEYSAVYDENGDLGVNDW